MGPDEMGGQQHQHGGCSPSQSQNPYAMFRFCCANLHTKEHAQLCGVVSFSMFLCLVVISLMLFGSLSVLYIVIGVIVYSLLMKSLFGVGDKAYVLLYLLFEAIQIGFYLALTFYIALPLVFYRFPLENARQRCDDSYPVPNENQQPSLEDQLKMANCNQSLVQEEEYMELLLFVVILAAVKMYFARVFANFYKFLIWQEKSSIHCAQYINGRGVQFSAIDQMFPPPPPGFWDNAVVKDQDYAYDQQRQQQRGMSPRLNVANFANADDLPSYNEATASQKQRQKSQCASSSTPMENGGASNTGNGAESSRKGHEEGENIV